MVLELRFPRIEAFLCWQIRRKGWISGQKLYVPIWGLEKEAYSGVITRGHILLDKEDCCRLLNLTCQQSWILRCLYPRYQSFYVHGKQNKDVFFVLQQAPHSNHSTACFSKSGDLAVRIMLSSQHAFFGKLQTLGCWPKVEVNKRP